MAVEESKVYVSAEAQLDEAINKLKELTTEFQKAANGVEMFENSMSGVKVANTQAATTMNKTNANLHSIGAGANEDKILFNTLASATVNLSKNVNKLNTTLDSLINKSAETSKAVRNVSKSIDKTANDMAAQSNRFTTGNIAAQFQDIFVTAQMGMRPLTIALQQGTQLVYALQQTGAPLKDLIAGFKSLISPLSLVTIGLTGYVAVLIQGVDWMETGKNALNTLANGFDYVAEHINAFNGVLLPVLAGMVVHFISSIKWMEKLKAVFKATSSVIVASAKLIFNAWFMIPAMIVGFVEAVGLFPEQSKKVANAVIDVFEEMINTIIGAFNAMAQSIGVIMGGIVAGVESGSIDTFKKTIADTFNDLLNEKYVDLSDVKTVTAGIIDGTAEMVEKVNTSVSSFISTTGDKLRDLAKGLGETTKDTEKLQKEIDKINDSYENLFTKRNDDLEKSKFKDSLEGLTAYEKTYQTVVYEMTKDIEDLKKEAIAAGIPLTKINEMFANSKTRIQEAALAEAEYAQEKENLIEFEKAYNAVIDQGASLTKGFFSDLKSGLKEGQSAWESFTNAVVNMLDKIQDKIMDLAIDMAFENLKSSGGSGSGSLLGSLVSAGMSLFGGIGGSSDAISESGGTIVTNRTYSLKAANGGVFSNGIYSSPTVFQFAKGGKFGVMGEAGPEAVVPLKRSKDGSLGISADGIGDSSPVIVNVINNSNAQARTEKRQTDQGVEIDVLIDEMVAQKLGTNGTASNSALRAYNNRQLIMR